ncbi:MAG: hypothetical protein TYPL_1390 [Candidatus Tyloplasma litorale]|nr:MAG: hypothetical protein TYPL_1390 [Mycoplasmatales bacterium]
MNKFKQNLKIIDKDTNKKVWRLPIILLCEFIGTFLMVFEIIAPSALGLDQFNWYNNIFGTFIMKSFWVTFFILILIYVFRNISVNLNPAVTLGEVAVGNTPWKNAGPMIAIQFIGAIIAAYFAYWMGSSWSVFNSAWESGTETLDAVYPVIKVSSTEQVMFGWDNAVYLDQLNGINLWEGIDGVNSTFVFSHTSWIAFDLVPFFIEATFTFILISTIVYFPKVRHGVRPYFIFFPLLIMVALGIHTNNIALNPARLIAPAFVSQTMGEAATLQFTWIFLLGELFAVLLVFKIESVKNTKRKTSKIEISKKLSTLEKNYKILETKYDWMLKGKKNIENMTKRELIYSIKKLNFQDVISSKLERDEIQEKLLEQLILKNKIENNKLELSKDEYVSDDSLKIEID